MSIFCKICGQKKKSNKGDRCRICSNRETGRNIERNKKLSFKLKGKKHSDETRKKIRDRALERFLDKRNHPRYGIVLSKEIRQKISESLKGDKHPNWKGGRLQTNNGYVWIYNPQHPLASKTSPIGYVLEHRLVMCNILGRILIKDEIVHHINGIRNDNRPENLFLTTKGKHISQHNHQRIWKEESKEKHRIKAKKLKRNNNGRFIGY